MCSLITASYSLNGLPHNGEFVKKLQLTLCHNCIANLRQLFRAKLAVLACRIKSPITLTRRALIGSITSIAPGNPKAIK